MDAHQLWQAALGQLELRLDKPTYHTWVKDTRAISFEDGVLVVGVKSAYAKDWLENRLYGTIQRTVSEIYHRTTDVRFIVQKNGVELRSGAPSHTELLDLNGTANCGFPGPDDLAECRVNPKYTFASFVVGQSNRLAHAGCLAVAENPGLAYNPLFIYGGVGLGKTHLLHAIGNRVLQDAKRTLYVSAETFANGIINAIRRQSTDEFRARYRNIDVLLLDDVQFLINKERTQEEFFHTFNDLYQDNKQIILSSDRPPKAFVGLEERLRSRFEWGLIADIQPPDLETRMAILVTKAEASNVTLPPEVVEFIAREVQSNIRELEGALNRFLALARMMDYPLTVQTAQKALGEVTRPPVKVGIGDILAVVALHYNLKSDDITGRRRTRDIAMARQ
ncbi:MAG: chromosomal replication initiator protein DnaA, partial [Chloroflexi bacterium]|nr:chromosomal replication initiator protein DnaA [Chloroflexota bacterium]